jgi:hypothetical protein
LEHPLFVQGQDQIQVVPAVSLYILQSCPPGFRQSCSSFNPSAVSAAVFLFAVFFFFVIHFPDPEYSAPEPQLSPLKILTRTEKDPSIGRKMILGLGEGKNKLLNRSEKIDIPI